MKIDQNDSETEEFTQVGCHINFHSLERRARMVNDWSKLGRHVVSAGLIDCFKRQLDESKDKDDRWDR